MKLPSAGSDFIAACASERIWAQIGSTIWTFDVAVFAFDTCCLWLEIRFGLSRIRGALNSGQAINVSVYRGQSITRLTLYTFLSPRASAALTAFAMRSIAT